MTSQRNDPAGALAAPSSARSLPALKTLSLLRLPFLKSSLFPPFK